MSGSDKKASGAGNRRALLTERLVELVNGLDEETLENIVMQVDSMSQVNRVREQRRKLGESLEKLGSGRRLSTPADRSEEPAIEVVENKSGQSFVIVMNGERNFMPLDEMRKIVALCHKAEDEADGAKRLAGYFQRYRPEVMRNSALAGAKDPHLVLLYKYLVEHYSVKE